MAYDIIDTYSFRVASCEKAHLTATARLHGHMTNATPIHLTIYFDGENFKLLDGPPSTFGLTATAEYRLEMGDEESVWWMVGCDLSRDEVRWLARRLLRKL
jgi:hypothetical protein